MTFLTILGCIIGYVVFTTLTAVGIHEYNSGGCCSANDELPWCVTAGLSWPITLPCFVTYRVAKAMFAPKPKSVNTPKLVNTDESYKLGSWKK